MSSIQNKVRTAGAACLALGAALLVGARAQSGAQSTEGSLGSVSEAITYLGACTMYGVTDSQEMYSEQILADLAGASAVELGRWMPKDDFQWVDVNIGLQLSDTGAQRCADRGGCPHIAALLFLQTPETDRDQGVYLIKHHDPAGLRGLLNSYWSAMNSAYTAMGNGQNTDKHAEDNRLTQTGTYAAGPNIRTFRVDRANARNFEWDAAQNCADQSVACPISDPNEKGMRVWAALFGVDGQNWPASGGYNTSDPNKCLNFDTDVAGDSVIKFRFGYDEPNAGDPNRSYVYTTTAKSGACQAYNGDTLFSGTWTQLPIANLYYCK